MKEDNEILSQIKELHRQKDAGYGNAWKRRGEFVSILANIARKVDRIEEFEKKNIGLPNESILDTAIDLFVYLTKYRLYLMEGDPNCVRRLPEDARYPFSDFTENFDALADSTAVLSPEPEEKVVCRMIVGKFEELFNEADRCAASASNRRSAVDELSEIALTYVLQLARRLPNAVLEHQSR